MLLRRSLLSGLGLLQPEYLDLFWPKSGILLHTSCRQYLPCVSMAGRALLAGYPQCVCWIIWWELFLITVTSHECHGISRQSDCLLNSLFGLITKASLKLPILQAVCEENPQVLLTKGQYCGKPPHTMTSTWEKGPVRQLGHNDKKMSCFLYTEMVLKTVYKTILKTF